jgi:hypothetical protein
MFFFIHFQYNLKKLKAYLSFLSIIFLVLSLFLKTIKKIHKNWFIFWQSDISMTHTNKQI